MPEGGAGIQAGGGASVTHLATPRPAAVRTCGYGQAQTQDGSPGVAPVAGLAAVLAPRVWSRGHLPPGLPGHSPAPLG